MSNWGVPAQEQQDLCQIISGAVVLSAISFYPELVSGSPEERLKNLKILKRVQDKKDAAAITHATHNRRPTTHN